jgi:hypothetical protein
MVEKKINLNIVDGDAFFSHETSINFSPTQFILDFKCITPRVDQRNKEAPSLNLKHNVVVIDAYHAKKVYGLLGSLLKKYEKEFGKIEKPKAIKMLEKKRKKSDKAKVVSETETPSYLG